MRVFKETRTSHSFRGHFLVVISSFVGMLSVLGFVSWPNHGSHLIVTYYLVGQLPPPPLPTHIRFGLDCAFEPQVVSQAQTPAELDCSIVLWQNWCLSLTVVNGGAQSSRGATPNHAEWLG